MKNYFLLILVVFAVIFVSCEKDEHDLVEKPENYDSEIVIKTTQAGETQSVLLNDTIIGQRNINTIFWTESGESVHWHIVELSSHNYGLTHDSFKFGPQIDFMFKHHGVYMIVLREHDSLYSDIIYQFYIRIEGIPGIIGDGEENNHIFRMEIMKDISQEEYLFVYYKFTDDYLEHYIWIQDSHQYTMNKFIYSDYPYYYFQLPIESGAYNIKFMKLIEGSVFFMDDGNMKFSSYYAGNNYLQFFLP